MSYQVLARKWRPYQFTDVVGQLHVLKALCNALRHNRLHHAYLLSGTRGVGKTTIARIFAKGLNCEQGVSATPCGQCSTCIEIEQGRCVDLLEIDAASRTKVEDTRELLDNVQYKPARCRYKIYLIDEVHMLSRHSFNALLKTLEEPPEYVKFILATTDPQKLPVTILSRCLQFHLKPLQPEQIISQLSHILEQEQIDAEETALAQLAQAADGSMRDALSLADQAIALGNGKVTTLQVSEMLGTINTDQALVLIEALLNQNAKHLFQVLAQLVDIGIEWDALLKELASLFHRIALAQMLADTVDPALPDAKRLLALSLQLTPEEVQLFYQIALQGRQDLPLAPDAKSGVEMTLIRMLAFKPAEVAPMPISGFEPNRQPPFANANQQDSSSSNHQKLKPEESMQKQNELSTASYSQHAAIAANLTHKDEQLIKRPTERITAQLATQSAMASAAVAEDKMPAKPVNALLAARSLLRSNKSLNKQSEEKSSKKSDSVLSIAPPLMTGMSLSAKDIKKTIAPKTLAPQKEAHLAQKEEAYRWQSSAPLEEVVYQDITPEKIKTALKHERSQEMREKLEREAQQQDLWSQLISELSISQLSKQLALNAGMEKQNSDVNLFLRKAQAHLATEKNQIELTKALSLLLKEDITLTIQINDTQSITPLEWRDKLYAEKLAQAIKSLSADNNVNFICQRFAAIVDKDSIRPI